MQYALRPNDVNFLHHSLKTICLQLFRMKMAVKQRKDRSTTTTTIDSEPASHQHHQSIPNEKGIINIYTNMCVCLHINSPACARVRACVGVCVCVCTSDATLLYTVYSGCPHLAVHNSRTARKTSCVNSVRDIDRCLQNTPPSNLIFSRIDRLRRRLHRAQFPNSLNTLRPTGTRDWLDTYVASSTRPFVRTIRIHRTC